MIIQTKYKKYLLKCVVFSFYHQSGFCFSYFFRSFQSPFDNPLILLPYIFLIVCKFLSSALLLN